MKTFVPSMLLFAFFALSVKQLNAQCTVSNIVIQNTRNVISTSGSCTVTFDISFNIESNNGNKYIFIHAWVLNQYPNYFKCVNGQTTTNGAVKAPTAADLGNYFLTLGIDNSSTTPTILSSYPKDPSVTMTSASEITKIVAPDGSITFILKGVTTTVPVSCSTPTVIVADLWSSQSASAQVAHCVNCGIKYSAGYLRATGFVNCASLMYGATLTNATAQPIQGFYRVYADVNMDGYFTPAIDTILSGPTDFNINGGVGTTTTITGSVPGANLNQNVFILLTQTSGEASGASRVVFLPSTSCSPLPVTFNTFSARRVNNSNVALRWETTTEINNRGFVIEKNTGDNKWESVVFINTQAPGGNSSSIMSYTYNDINRNNNITQYRIQQIDLDAKAKYSEIRSVRGDGQSGKTIVYPNPSNNGNVNILFEENDAARDVMLVDMSGRILQQWRNTNSNTIQIYNLQPGVYSLRIIKMDTKEQSIEKIVVAGSR
ncbi:MAG: T9SS type A sorting domain-containing protein [Chitinophagaceae bacterium]